MTDPAKKDYKPSPDVFKLSKEDKIFAIVLAAALVLGGIYLALS